MLSQQFVSFSYEIHSKLYFCISPLIPTLLCAAIVPPCMNAWQWFKIRQLTTAPILPILQSTSNTPSQLGAQLCTSCDKKIIQNTLDPLSLRICASILDHSASILSPSMVSQLVDHQVLAYMDNKRLVGLLDCRSLHLDLRSLRLVQSYFNTSGGAHVPHFIGTTACTQLNRSASNDLVNICTNLRVWQYAYNEKSSHF